VCAHAHECVDTGHECRWNTRMGLRACAGGAGAPCATHPFRLLALVQLVELRHMVVNGSHLYVVFCWMVFGEVISSV
jgi:hypothetical protein